MGATSVPASRINLVSAIHGPGLVLSPLQRFTTMDLVQATQSSRTGTEIAPTAGTHSRSSMLDLALWGSTEQGIAQDRTQLLQMLQQQRQALLAASAVSSGATLSSGVASLSPLSANFFSQPEGSLGAARAQLKKEHAKLNPHTILQNVSMSSAHDPFGLSSLVRERAFNPHSVTVANPVAETKPRNSPYPSNAVRQPEPFSEGGDDDSEDSEPCSPSKEKFPFKLYRMLDEAEKNGDDSIISFLPHGRAFVIHKPRAFVVEVMPKYFSTTRMTSFQRQLNLYGFQRITDGTDKGGYFHQFFLQGRKSLCRKIRRKIPACRSTTPPPSAERGFSTENLANPFAASTRSALNQAILAQLNEENQLQRQLFSTPSQRSISGREVSTLPAAGQAAPTVDATRLVSEIVAIEQQRSDLFREFVRAQQLQHQAHGMEYGRGGSRGQSDDLWNQLMKPR